MKTEVYRIPEWSLPYLINGDIEGCSDYEINEMNRWLETNHIDTVGMPEEYDCKYFSASPAFGSPCEVYDITCVIF